MADRQTGTERRFRRQTVLVGTVESGVAKTSRVQVVDDTYSTKNFYVEPYNASITAYPVVGIRPTGGDRVLAFDLLPSGNPVENSNGFVWVDICHNQSNPITARIAITSAGAVFGSQAYGTSDPLPTFLMAGGTNGLRVDTDGKVTALAPLVLKSYAVSALPAASAAGQGARAFVTDASATMAAGVGSTVAGGGSNKVPVYSDGTNWKIG